MIVKEHLSNKFIIEQDNLNLFSEASGGIGKIHTDPEYARQTAFGGTLVHGILLVALIEKELESKIDSWAEKGRLQVTFIKPVLSGKEFFIKLERNQDNEIIVTVLCEEEVVSTGKAMLSEALAEKNK
jgi:acyl dehydratase